MLEIKNARIEQVFGEGTDMVLGDLHVDGRLLGQVAQHVKITETGYIQIETVDVQCHDYLGENPPEDGEIDRALGQKVAEFNIENIVGIMQSFNRLEAPGSECRQWQDFYQDFSERFDCSPDGYKEAPAENMTESFFDYWLNVSEGYYYDD